MDEVYDTIEKHLITSEIPFHKDKFRFVLGKSSIGRNFIIPGAIIFVASKNKFKHEGSILTYEKQLISYKDCGIKQTIYMYLYDIDEDDIPQLLSDSQLNTYGINLKLVASLDKLVPAPYIYYIPSGGTLYTFAVKENVEEFQTVPIYVSRYEYDRACTHMTDDEIEMVNRVNLVIVDELPKDVYVITYTNKNRPIKNKKNYIVEFNKKIQFIPLPGGTRPTIRFIEGHTLICKKCGHIYSNDYVKGGLCFKCVKKIAEI